MSRAAHPPLICHPDRVAVVRGFRAECPACGAFWDLENLGADSRYTARYPSERSHFDAGVGALKVATLERWLALNALDVGTLAVCEVGFGGGHCLARMHATARSACGIETIEADVEVDGLPVPFRQFTFFFAATVDRIALGFRPTYMGTRKPGYMHVLGGPISAVRLISKAIRVYRGFPTYEPALYDNLARNLCIRFFRPQHYMLDGDILPPADRLDVDVACRVTLIRA